MKPRLIQAFFFALALAFLGLAALMQGPLDRISQQYELQLPGNVVMQNHPEFAVLQVCPGGLRAPLINYLWIRADKLKEQRRFQEVKQISDMICSLQPRSADVWGFCAWNQAWNISVETHTEEERWYWVNSGVELLRDRGIPLNPRSLILYKELGWIYFSKMGGTTDEMHMVYKRRLAGQMQMLLGAPPVGETEEVLAAFKPIADAPLDKDPSRKTVGLQEDRLAWLVDPSAAARDPQAAGYYSANAAEYLKVLKANNIVLLKKRSELEDDSTVSLLGAYNRYSHDESVESVRLVPLENPSDHDKQLVRVINDPRYAVGRAKLLAFVRAQHLWNRLKLDPQWMLGLMKRFGPLDWRLPWAHGLYWESYGIHVCESVQLDDVDSLNTNRTLLDCLKALTWEGRLSYVENPRNIEMPLISTWSDWRFVKPTLKEYDHYIKATLPNKDVKYKDNLYRGGHINYMTATIQMLYAADRMSEAQNVFDTMKKSYDLKGEDYDFDVEAYAMSRLGKDGIIADQARNQYTSAVVTAMAYRAVGGNDNERKARAYLRYAESVFNEWQKDAAARHRMPEFKVVIAPLIGELLVRPEVYGRRLSLPMRQKLYLGLDVQTQQMMFDSIAPFLKRQCQAAGLSFERSFPEPEGMDEFRRAQQGDPLAPPPPGLR